MSQCVTFPFQLDFMRRAGYELEAINAVFMMNVTENLQ